MHFNKKREENTNTTDLGVFDEDFNMYRLLAVDTITIDQYSRLTLTNEVKNVLNIQAQDKIAVYQDTYNPDELLFRIQRGYRLVDNWKLTRKNMGIDYNEKKSSAPSVVHPSRIEKGPTVVVLLPMDFTTKMKLEISYL